MLTWQDSGWRVVSVFPSLHKLKREPFLSRYRKNMRIKVREQARQTQIFFDDLQREMERE
jgi:hypothetical protein